MKKILCLFDHFARTGYGIVSEQLVAHLTNHFGASLGLHIIATNYFGEPVEVLLDGNIRTVYVESAKLSQDPERTPEHLELDDFGRMVFLERLGQMDFDGIFIMQDLGIITPMIPLLKGMKEGKAKANKKQFKSVFYFPVDCQLPVKYFEGIEFFDLLVTYTEYARKQVLAYNPGNDSWNPEESMPTARSYLGVAVVNDELYAIGGFDGTNWLDVNEQYKPVGYGTVAPRVQITSPEENKTYAAVTLSFTINRATLWMGYRIDNGANVTIKAETTLSGLTEGAHNVIIYANDTSGNMGASNTVTFIIDTLPPDIVITLPQNRSYDANEIQLTFTVNEAVSYLAYSLDGQGNVTIIGNITLPALADGSHHLTLYATDKVGNSAQRTVTFDIAPFPMVTVVAVLTVVIIVLAGAFLFMKREKSFPRQ